MTFGGIGLGVLIGVMGAILVRIGWRASATIRALRAAIFDACLPCFDDYRITQDSVDFPVLDGHLRRRRVLLEPVVDAVTVRKLPVLWLRVTLLEPLPMGAALSLLVRPQGTEFWSPSAELRHRLPIPAGWPEHALLRSDQPDVAHLLSKLSPHVEAFFFRPARQGNRRQPAWRPSGVSTRPGAALQLSGNCTCALRHRIPSLHERHCIPLW